MILTDRPEQRQPLADDIVTSQVTFSPESGASLTADVVQVDGHLNMFSFIVRRFTLCAQ